MRTDKVLRALARGCTACAVLAAASAANAQLSEDWSSGTENGWTTSSDNGLSTWFFDGFLGEWFGDDIAPPDTNEVPESQYLTSPTFTMGADFGLEVDHWFDMEDTFDGGVVEISVNGGAFTYLPDSAIFLGEHYDAGTISTFHQSHIGGLQAFTGVSSGGAGTFVTTTFNLNGFAFAGDMVQVRFRLATDVSVSDDGWYITRVAVVPLVDPTGACCFADGSCTDGSQSACQSAGGTFNEGVACGAGLCPILAVGEDCIGARPIMSLPFTDSATELENYSGSPDLASCNSSSSDVMNNDVWWSFAGTGQRVRLSMSDLNGTFDEAFAVFAGTDCNSLVQLGCHDPSTLEVDFDTQVGVNYYFVAMNWSSAALTSTGNGVMISLDVAPPAAPGDACSTATPVMSVPFSETIFDMENRRGEFDLASCNSSSSAIMNNDAWWAFQGTGQRMRVTMDDVNFDGAFAVFEGFDCDSFVQLGCSDPAPFVLDFDTQLGMTYYLVAMQWSNAALSDTGNEATITLEIAPPPPANDECDAPTILTLDVPAAGTTFDASGTDVASCGFDERDVWYAFLPNPNTNYRVFTTGAGSNMSLAVFQQECPPAGFELACGDPSTTDASVDFTSDSIGSAVFIRAATDQSAQTSFDLTIIELAGACTGTDGLCRQFTPTDCAAAGGTFAGGDCVTGACCTGGVCSTSTAGDCADGGGAYQGDGVACGTESVAFLPIGPDFDTFTMDTLTLSGEPTSVAGLTLTVNLDHTFLGDLEIDLIHVASGTAVRVMEDQCGLNDNMSVTFDDLAPAMVCNSPTEGTFAPFSPLSALDGLDANGDWTLQIRDDAAGDGGTLNDWSISFVGGAPCGSAPSCACETDGADGVDVFDLLAYLDLWFVSAGGADIDGAAGVDVFDLLFFLDCWFPASAGAAC